MHRATSIVFERAEYGANAAQSCRSEGQEIAEQIARASSGLDVVLTQQLLEHLSCTEVGGRRPVWLVLRRSDMAVLASNDHTFLRSVASRQADGIRLELEIRNGPNLEVMNVRTSDLWSIGDEALLVMLPPSPSRDEGEHFAGAVWRVAAPALLAVVFVSVLLVMWILRTALKPLEDVARAARRLHRREKHAQLRHTGNSEVDELIDAFNEASVAIASADAMRREFIADIAHELRTPVTNLSGQVEAVEAGLIEPSATFVATLRAEVRVLQRLIEDFQELALSDAGKLSIFLQPVAVKDTLVEILEPMAAQHGFGLQLEAPDDAIVMADPERLRQVFGNLVENSIRFCSAANLALDVCARARGGAGTVTIDVRDNGPGVPEQDRARIFERFYRAEKSRNRGSGGAGLGLAIVKGLMTAMGGDVAYVSEEAGATFRLTLRAANVSRAGS
ncbi:MAG: ATP-binding protein [Hyphomonadaceae bacterium]